jgi:hypothetical protein
MAFIDYYKVLEWTKSTRAEIRHTAKWPGNTIPFESNNKESEKNSRKSMRLTK